MGAECDTCSEQLKFEVESKNKAELIISIY
jgi:hypothetical protein